MNILFRLILLIICFYTNVQDACSQQKISFIDIEKKEIGYVYVQSLDSTFGAHSNSNGEFEVLPICREKKIFTIEKYGYITRVVSFDTIINNIQIQLTKNEQVFELEEVLVTASKPELEEVKLNYFKNVVRGVHGFESVNLKGVKSAQFVNKSDFLVGAKILKFNINASAFPLIINIRFFDRDKEGLPSNPINKEPIICSIEKEGWNQIDLEKFKIRIPENGLFLEYEIFYKPTSSIESPTTLAVLSGYTRNEENFYPLYKKNNMSNRWEPKTYIDGTYIDKNLAFYLNVRALKTKVHSFKKSLEKKELSDKKKNKIFDKKMVAIPFIDSVKYPNKTIQDLLTSSINLINENNQNYLLFHFYLCDNKKRLLETLELWNKPSDALVQKRNLTIKVFENALNNINNGIDLIIDKGYYTMFLEFNFEGKSQSFIIHFYETQDGWKFDERNINEY